MSKFFKALEQAERDRALQQGRTAESAGPTAPAAPDIQATQAVPRQEPLAVVEATEPMTLQQPPADSADGVDDHLVSLLAPAAFEAEQYRALRYTIEQLRKTRDLRIVAVS